MTGVARGAPDIGFPGSPHKLLLLARSVTSRKAALHSVSTPGEVKH
jgi:hypothetical protein